MEKCGRNTYSKMYGISIFLPVYNEEKILEDHVMLVYNYIKKLGYDFEIVIVNDSSKDNTANVADQLIKKHKEIKHMHFDNGPSRRENLAVAMTKATYSIVIFLDMDLSVDLSYIQNLILEINKGYDIAIGSRYMGLKPHREFYRLMISKAYNKFMRIVFSSQIKDHNCGFKAMRKDVIIKMVEELGYDDSFLRGWFWDAEFLIRAQINKYRIAEFPVTWDTSKQSSFNLRREIRMFPYIVKRSKSLIKISWNSTQKPNQLK